MNWMLLLTLAEAGQTVTASSSDFGGTALPRVGQEVIVDLATWRLESVQWTLQVSSDGCFAVSGATKSKVSLKASTKGAQTVFTFQAPGDATVTWTPSAGNVNLLGDLKAIPGCVTG